MRMEKKFTRMIDRGKVNSTIKESAGQDLEIIEDWESWWWKNLNPKCLQCQQDCKQSAMVEALIYSQYQKVEDKNDKE